jgi:hypothetical protein
MIGQTPSVERDFSIRDYIPGQPIPLLVRDPVTKEVVVNPLKRWVKPFTLTTEPATIVLGANALSEPIPMTLDNKGHFEVMQAFFQSSEAQGFTVQLFDPEMRALLQQQNRELHVSTLASGGGVVTPYEAFPAVGSAGRPFRWPETLWIHVGDKGKALFAVFRNLSGNQNTIRFNLHGLRWYHLQAPSKVAERMEQIYHGRLRTFPFFYTTEQNITLAALASGEFEMRFTDEAWVEWFKGMDFTTNGNYNVRIREKTAGKRFMEQPIRNDLVFGNGEFPFLNWESSLFEPNYKLVFEVENLSPGTNRIFLTLACRKILIDPADDRLLRPGQAGGMP